MKGIEAVIISPLGGTSVIQSTAGIITATGGTDQLMTEVSMAKYPLAREFVLSGRLTGNTTAVGSAKYYALNWYWSDTQISVIDSTLVAANTLLLMAKRKYTTGPVILDNLTLANGGDVLARFIPAITLNALTITASTTTATAVFLGTVPINVNDMITVVGGATTGNGNYMQGTYPVASVSQSGGVTTITYTITSSTGTLAGATVQVANTIRRGGNDKIADAIQRPIAPWLYVSIDTPAFTSNATLALTVNLIRVPSTAINL